MRIRRQTGRVPQKGKRTCINCMTKEAQLNEFWCLQCTKNHTKRMNALREESSIKPKLPKRNSGYFYKTKRLEALFKKYKIDGNSLRGSRIRNRVMDSHWQMKRAFKEEGIEI